MNDIYDLIEIFEEIYGYQPTHEDENWLQFYGDIQSKWEAQYPTE